MSILHMYIHKQNTLQIYNNSAAFMRPRGDGSSSTMVSKTIQAYGTGSYGYTLKSLQVAEFYKVTHLSLTNDY